MSTPTSTVTMYCSTTLFGTMALPGSSGTTHTTNTKASTRIATACQNGCAA